MTVVLIDGRSGAGKTELARAFVASHPEFQLVQLDDLYKGWEGLEGASAEVPRILSEGSWLSWNWGSDSFGPRRHIDTTKPVLVEGAGALTRASRSLADLAIWVELADNERRQRAISRDGETFAPHWDRWASQESAHIARESPRDLADVIVDGTDAQHALSIVDAELERLI